MFLKKKRKKLVLKLYGFKANALREKEKGGEKKE